MKGYKYKSGENEIAVFQTKRRFFTRIKIGKLKHDRIEEKAMISVNYDLGDCVDYAIDFIRNVSTPENMRKYGFSVKDCGALIKRVEG